MTKDVSKFDCKEMLIKGIVISGQQDDARMCLAIALTATRHGATVANHVRALALHKDNNGKICGARLKDEISGWYHSPLK
jgi:glycerol-3-phosphate dehydrogenase